MTIKYTSFKNAAALDKAITECVEKAHSLRSDIQNVAVGILLHAYKHGDYTRAESLVNGLGQGVRGKALVDWFVKFGGLVIGENGGQSGFIGWQGAEYIKANIDAAKAQPWWELKPEKPYEGFDLTEALEKLIKKAEKAVKQANDYRHKGDTENADKVKVPAVVLDALRAAKAANAA